MNDSARDACRSASCSADALSQSTSMSGFFEEDGVWKGCLAIPAPIVLDGTPGSWAGSNEGRRGKQKER